MFISLIAIAQMLAHILTYSISSKKDCKAIKTFCIEALRRRKAKQDFDEGMFPERKE